MLQQRRDEVHAGKNNNAYCQDNEISWLDWEGQDDGLLEFAALADRPAARPSGLPPLVLVQGKAVHGTQVRDLGWFRPDGGRMSDEDW